MGPATEWSMDSCLAPCDSSDSRQLLDPMATEIIDLNIDSDYSRVMDPEMATRPSSGLASVWPWCQYKSSQSA